MSSDTQDHFLEFPLVFLHALPDALVLFADVPNADSSVMSTRDHVQSISHEEHVRDSARMSIIDLANDRGGGRTYVEEGHWAVVVGCRDQVEGGMRGDVVRLLLMKGGLLKVEGCQQLRG